MEVHKHPHHVSHKKKLAEYFLEFLMIFLAVFLGFIAENIREKAVDKEIEKKYIISLIRDLKTDTTNLNDILSLDNQIMSHYDTLLTLLKHFSVKGINEIYYHYIQTTAYYIFFPTDRTIQQLKNGGQLKLISDWQVSDTITKYYENAKLLIDQSDTYLRYLDKFQDQAVN